MILNVATVVTLFLAAVGALLASAVLFVAAHTLWTYRRHPEGQSRDRVGDRAYLLTLLVGALGLTQLMAWPSFYSVMQSYVEPLSASGVMCIFGITRIEPQLVLLLQIVKPVLLLTVGLWWLMVEVDRRTHNAPLLPVRLMLCVPLAGLALFATTAETRYLLRDKGGQRVTCCTQFLRTEATALPSDATPWVTLGIDSAGSIVGLFAAFHAAVIAGCVLRWRQPFPNARIGGMLWTLGLALAGMANLVIAHWTWLELLAPRVLQLPYHHCVYELLTETVALGPAAVMTLAGNACLWWPVALAGFRHRAPDPVAVVQQRVYGLCAVALASELLIVGVHLM